MKFLVSNDDGIDAPGIRTLWEVAKTLGNPVLVAPAGPQSGVSHTVSWEKPVRIEERGAREYAVHGTPADCTRMGLLHLAPDTQWVLSGINHGGNLGADVHYSGTVAAVREAVLHGIPGIALSHFHARGRELDWKRASQWVRPVLADLLSRSVEPGLFYNVNLPHLETHAPDPQVVFCGLDPSPLPLSSRHENGAHLYDGDYQNRRRIADADVDTCFRGSISVSVVRLF